MDSSNQPDVYVYNYQDLMAKHLFKDAGAGRLGMSDMLKTLPEDDEENRKVSFSISTRL